MNIETLAPYLAGPGAGLLVCLLVGMGVYKFMASKVMPLLEGTVARHLQQIDSVSERHGAEHQAILDSLAELRRELTAK